MAVHGIDGLILAAGLGWVVWLMFKPHRGRAARGYASHGMDGSAHDMGGSAASCGGFDGGDAACGDGGGGDGGGCGGD